MAARADRMPNRTGTRRARDSRLAAGSLVWVRPAAHAICGGRRLPEHGEVFDRGLSFGIEDQVVAERGGDRLMARYQRSRTRRALKWAGLAVSVLLVAALVASVWVKVTLRRVPHFVEFRSGAATYCWFPAGAGGPHARWAVDRQIYPHLTGLPFVYHEARYFIIDVPIWMLAVLVAIPTAWLWWRDRRGIPPGHCQRCGYDLTGNVSGRCPECGECSRANKGHGLETKR